jgi:DNA-binding transcriptional regulator YiaG
MARPISKVDLTEPERQELEGRVKASTASPRDSLRAAIILRRAEGIKQAQVARELGVSVACVNKWSQCFDREGLAGLADAKGRGRPASLPADKVEQVLTAVTQPPKPRYALECSLDGPGGGDVAGQRAPHLEGQRPQAPFDQDLTRSPRTRTSRRSFGT